MAKITVGILSYKDRKYLEQGLPSLLAQDFQDIEILICDNNEDPNTEIKNWIQSEFPTIKVLNAGGNVGFGRGHNHLIKNAKGEYYLCFNSDMVASKDYISELLKPFQEDPKIAVTTGKILKWANFPKSPFLLNENYIDTVGLLPYKSHSFTERGYGQKDIGQFDDQVDIWGCSGASPMFKIDLIKKVAHSKDEFFDALFFMYKEDIDLMYRLNWAGFKIKYQPTAVAWHDRTAEDPGGIINNIKKRKNRASYIKENSFLNHLILLYKNWSWDYSYQVKLKTLLFILKYNFYLLFFDPKVLKVYTKFKNYLPEIQKKRQSMPKAVTAKSMEKWFL